MVRSAVEAAHATGGVVGNVSGRTLTVVWNASKRCSMHSTAALTFAQEMKNLKYMLQVGLSTGTMLHGNVGTRASRFPTAIGLPLDAAEAMTDHARMFGVYCLYADCTADSRLQSEATVRSCVRLVDIWLEASRKRQARIYEVCLERLQNAIQGWAGAMTSTSTGPQLDLERHTRVTEAAMRGGEGLNELRQLAAQDPSDRVLEVCPSSPPVPCRVAVWSSVPCMVIEMSAARTNRLRST